MEDERFEHTKWRVRGIRERRELRKQEERLNLLDEEMSVWMVRRLFSVYVCVAGGGRGDITPNPVLPSSFIHSNPLPYPCPTPFLIHLLSNRFQVERLTNVAPLPDKKILKLRLEAELRRNIVETEKLLRQRKETMGPIAKAVYEGKLRQRTLLHMASLSERKRTRQLIGIVVMWAQRVKRICRYNARMNEAVSKDAAGAMTSDKSLSKSQKEFVKVAKKEARKNKEAFHAFNATNGSRLLWQMAFRRRDETYQSESERLAKADQKSVNHRPPLHGMTTTSTSMTNTSTSPTPTTVADYVKNLAYENAASSTGRKASVSFLIRASQERKHIRFHSMAKALDETDQSIGTTSTRFDVNSHIRFFAVLTHPSIILIPTNPLIIPTNDHTPIH